MKDFHFCASCKHFEAKRVNRQIQYHCKRLGFKTMPDYKFNCWDPKENVKKLMEKENKA